MADGELAVCWGVARTEAGAAEALADDRACGDQIEDAPGLDEAGKGRHGAGIDIERERAVAAALAAQNVRRRADIVKGAAGAARDLALFDPNAAVVVLAHEIHGHTLELFVCLLLYGVEDVLRVFLQFVDGVGVGGMHWHGDGALHRGEIDIHTAVVPGNFGGVQLLVCLGSAVGDEVALGLLVGDPDGGPTGGLGGHDVDRVAVLDGEIGDAGADKLHGLVLHVAVFVHRADDGQSHVLRADAGTGCAGEVNGDHAGIGKIIGAL